MINKEINVMIVDDHRLFRLGLKEILEKNSFVKVVDEAENGQIALEKLDHTDIEITIMDLNMPVLNGLETLKRMKEIGCQSKVIMLTGYPKRQHIIMAARLGAKGFLQKNCHLDNILKAIVEVKENRNYLDPEILNILEYIDKKIEVNNSANKLDLEYLSNREYEILILLTEVYCNKEMGEILFISEKTIKNHLTNIFRKIGVKDRVQAILFAYSNNVK